MARVQSSRMFKGSLGRARLVSSAPPRYAKSGDGETASTRLSTIIKRVKERVERQVALMGEEALEDRLMTATMQGPGQNGFRFSQKVTSIGMRRGGPLTIFEVCRLDPTESSVQLAERAKRLVNAGADAICVRIDEDSTTEGAKDLFMVSNACHSVPIFAKDYFIHPIQIVDAKAAGATGIIGIVASVTQRASPVLSSFGAQLGLDCPVEVVNLKELKQMEGFGVPFFAMDISVRINLPIPGFSRQLISGVLSEMDFNALSLVGVSSKSELRGIIDSKADALYIKHDLVKSHSGEEHLLVAAVLDACNGDD